jgi:ketosteroid isomerase-like protein
MSQENVEIVRRGYERFNAGDIQGFLDLCDRGFEFHALQEFPGSDVFVGHDAVHGWWAQVYDAFDDLRFDADEFIDTGDQVVVPTTGTGRGTSSGASVEMHFSNVWTLSDRKLISCISYDHHAEALEAAGLSE